MDNSRYPRMDTPFPLHTLTGLRTMQNILIPWILIKFCQNFVQLVVANKYLENRDCGECWWFVIRFMPIDQFKGHFYYMTYLFILVLLVKGHKTNDNPINSSILLAEVLFPESITGLLFQAYRQKNNYLLCDSKPSM